MKASETKLQPVLEGTKQYLIPMFQRHYSWSKKHWQALWDDLLELYQAEDGRDHFLGAIVTMPVEMQPHGVSKYLLIDGQQRLTTLFVLLAVLRDFARDYDDRLADQLNEQYLLNKWAEGSNRFKLFPTQTDRETFAQIIQGNITTTSRLTNAYRFFIRKFRSMGPTFSPQKLHNILMQQFIVVMITLAEDENPYLIFESLNAKGQPLTQADLVRNYLFMRITDQDEKQIAYDELWHPMEEQLGGELTNFLWRYLTKDGTFIRQNSIYEAIKNRLSKLNTSNDVIDVLSDMHTYAGYYVRLIRPETEPDKRLRRNLERLNRWEISTAYPFLLALYHDYKQDFISAVDMCAIVETIESFVIRRFFCRISTNTLNRLFIGLYDSLDRTNMVGSLEEYLITRRWPTDDEFIDGWTKFPVYTSGTAKCRHILESLEEALTNNNEPVNLTYPRITIEHIMPQKLSTLWQQILGDEADQIHERYLHTIGNLTLTGNNEPMGNAPFSTKQKTFAASNFALNKDLTNPQEWDSQNIQRRARYLARTAKQIWQRPQVDETLIKKLNPTGSKPTGFKLFGQEYEVKTWREMLLKTVELLADLHGSDQFASKTTSVAGSKRNYIAYIQEGMANPILISGTNLWVETNLSSRSILSIISQIMESCGHDRNEFEAFW